MIEIEEYEEVVVKMTDILVINEKFLVIIAAQLFRLAPFVKPKFDHYS
jgi:hypothetical protein